ncbi:hypothetical protein [Nannocystis bainbridge]|uniref:AgmX/PglI C-terminal domain-containing protein n=1 Tax=Nannocystis bainbridge TaxID=2995303 RepID=A0ABT5DRX9_9BACT|nr:hypothetical protein [Nannocystis bainbridge]MDC0716411.1 hypothetical protein [Nannocystis bainbridge]
MASRGIYLVSAALLGGGGLLLWLVLADRPAPSAASATAPGTAVNVDGRPLGVAGADYDPASPRVEGDPAEPRRADPDGVARERDTVAQRPAAPPAPEQPPGPPVVGSPGLNAASEASEAVRPQVLAAVSAELASRRAALRQACWPPGSDFSATFTVEASYASDGALLTLGVSDVPGMPGVGACLTGQIAQKPPTLAAPPGADVTVAVPVEFAGTEKPPTPAPRGLDDTGPSR